MRIELIVLVSVVGCVYSSILHPSVSTNISDQSLLCRKCDVILDNLKDYIYAGVSNVQILKLMARQCDREIGTEDEQSLTKCKQVLAFNRLKEAMSLVQSGINDRMTCTLLEMCNRDMSNDTTHVGIEQNIGKSSETCVKCKKFIEALDKKYLNDDVENLVTGVLAKTCDTFPNKPTCVAEVTKGVKTAFDTMRKYLSDKICSEIGLCPRGALEYNERVTMIVNMEEVRKTLDDHFTSTNNIKTSAECEICMSITLVVEHALKNNATEAEIRKLLDNLCSMGSGEQAYECVQVVAYVTKALEIVSSRVGPRQICKSIGFCKAVSLKGSECDICKSLTKKLISYINWTDVRNEANALLLQVCNNVPEFKAECLKSVDKVVDLIVQTLKATITPERLCELAKVC